MVDIKTLKLLYYQMLRIRKIEESIAQNYQQQEIRCPVHLCIGQEAIAVGVCSLLAKRDVVMSNHRSHGHYLAKGGDAKKMIAELYGKSTGCSKGRGGSQHLIDLSVNFLGSTPIVGGTIPIATGVSWAAQLLRKKHIVVVFFGDAAIEEGIFHESINFSSLKHLPILYVCENNFYSILTPLSDRQPRRHICDIAKAHGLASWRSDGTDVQEVVNIAKKALSYIRSGKGPAFIEFLTYRLKEHCGPNDELVGARPEEEVAFWRKKDSLKQLKQFLLQKKVVDEKEIEQMKEKIDREIFSAFDYALKSPYLSEKPLTQYVYSS